MDYTIATSTALFQSTVGVAYSDLVSWMGGNLKLILGGGLGLVDALIGWIIAIIIIGVIVKLIFSGLRWLHILR